MSVEQLAPTPFKTDVDGTPVIATPPNWSLHQLPELLKQPPTIDHDQTVANNPSFVYYFNRFAKPATLVVASRKAKSIKAQLDFHENPSTPALDEHGLTRAYVLDRRYVAWKQRHGKTMGQKDFVEFLQDRMVDLATEQSGEFHTSFPTQADLLKLITQFKATQSMGCASAMNLANGDVQFNFTKETKSLTVELPEILAIQLPVFEFEREYVITTRLRYRLADGGQLAFWFELVKIDEFEDVAFLDAIADLKKLIGDKDIVLAD